MIIIITMGFTFNIYAEDNSAIMKEISIELVMNYDLEDDKREELQNNLKKFIDSGIDGKTLLETLKEEDFDVFEDILNKIEQLLDDNYSSDHINELLANGKIIETNFNSIENVESTNEKPSKEREIIFYDDFSDSTSGWENRDGNRFGLNYIDGEYEVKHKQFSSGRVSLPIRLERGLNHYSITVDAKLYSGSGSYGITINLINSDKNRADFIIINESNNKSFWLIINREVVKKINISNYVEKNKYNQLKLVQNNNKSKFYIDGDLIIEYDIPKMNKNSKVGLFTCTSNKKEKPTVRFDNYKLTNLDPSNIKDNKNSELSSDKYNTRQLRVNADYRVDLTNMRPATGEMYWVPSNKLGMPNTTIEELKELKGKPKKLQEEIDVLYEALAYIQVSEMESGSGNIAIYDDNKNRRWQFPAPAEFAIKENRANCVGITNVVNYLLKDDYEEIGGAWYHRSFIIGNRKGGHVVNYIKHNNKYYIFDALGYIHERDTYSSPENGETYHKGHKHGCIHEIVNNSNGEPKFKPYVESWRFYNENMAFMVLVPMDRFPIMGSSTASHNHDTDIFISDRSNLDKIMKIYDNPEDPQVLIEEEVSVDPPQEYEDYMPYNSM